MQVIICDDPELRALIEAIEASAAAERPPGTVTDRATDRPPGTDAADAAVTQ